MFHEAPVDPLCVLGNNQGFKILDISVYPHGKDILSKMLIRVYIKGSKNWNTGKVIAYGGYFYFAPNAAANFLEREIGMKRE